VLNRIRRAASLTRARYFPKGRHRRPLRPSRPTPAPTSSAFADEPTAVLGQGRGHRTRPSIRTGARRTRTTTPDGRHRSADADRRLVDTPGVH
jgi:hypothetical protein